MEPYFVNEKGNWKAETVFGQLKRQGVIWV